MFALYRKINAMPLSKALAISFTGAFLIAGSLMAFHVGTMKPVRTMNKEWKAATEQYMRFYNMNPIHGISKDQHWRVDYTDDE